MIRRSSTVFTRRGRIALAFVGLLFAACSDDARSQFGGGYVGQPRGTSVPSDAAASSASLGTTADGPRPSDARDAPQTPSSNGGAGGAGGGGGGSGPTSTAGTDGGVGGSSGSRDTGAGLDAQAVGFDPARCRECEKRNC